MIYGDCYKYKCSLYRMATSMVSFTGRRGMQTLTTVAKHRLADSPFGILPNCSCVRFYSDFMTAPNAMNEKLLRVPLARYGGRQTVTALPGDGIGPEMLQHVKRIFRYAQVPVDFEDIPLDSGSAGSQQHFENALISIERNGVCLKGNVETKFDDPLARSRNVDLRVRLGLYANVLWCKNMKTVPSRHQNVDVVLIRENMEGEYSGMEHEAVPGVVESLKIVTRPVIEKIAMFGFDYAIKHGRKKVTAVHKANIMKLGDGLFLSVCREVASQYPGIEFDDMIVDNASMQMVANPQQFDLMLMPNLYGNIISNIGCGLVGGPGLVSGMNIGDKYAVFETGTRNTGTDLAGKDIANPTSFIRASIDMLFYLGMDKHAELIWKALKNTLEVQKLHTRDIGGDSKTSEVVDGLVRFVEERMPHYI